MQTFEDKGEKWATIQKQDTQFRAKQYQVKLKELMLLPNQTAGKQDHLEENVDKPKDPQELEDEFAEIDRLTYNLFNVILKRHTELEKI